MDYQQLLAAVPGRIRGGCEPAEVEAGALAGALCRSGADEVRYLLFAGEEDLAPAFRDRLDGLPAGATEGLGCGEGPGQRRLPDGRLACYRGPNGSAVTVWTNDLVFVLATAARADGDWAALEDFRRTAGPITP
jgi:hypothetical protein